MTITIGPELEAALAAYAKRQGTDPETLAVGTLHSCFLPKSPEPIPHDEWLKRLRALTIKSDVYLTDEDMSREVIYADDDPP